MPALGSNFPRQKHYLSLNACFRLTESHYFFPSNRFKIMINMRLSKQELFRNSVSNPLKEFFNSVDNKKIDFQMILEREDFLISTIRLRFNEM